MKLNELKSKLEMLLPIADPSPSLEQYSTPVNAASAILYHAAMSGDIEGRKIADLGCGNGIFSIGCALLGAYRTIGADVSPACIKTSKENAARILDSALLKKVHFKKASILEIKGRFDTVFQNPPFGSQSRNADIPFIKKALELADVVYTIHISATRAFIEEKIAEYGGRIEFSAEFDYSMPRMFKYHTDDRRKFRLILYKAVKNNKQRDR
ncbi:MAG: METTL5 family protein [Candidatus Thermoplasmatota archaeon]|jgi:putative methylase|nr:methyltransferase [Candidatus Sysuiplasma jiujiangense]MBX8639854.1 METTL5 family protein [Candidatus Sysuiplasma jiujiangense]MBX8641890.1 METTL5 family protein [Candidatus Sysuiplasma jiujiangense]MCL5254115.1 METTL5 family protein [Candidatus Thermoplasmatota archaeon]